MMPDLASMAAQESSMETVPIMITTSRIRSSSAEPEGERSEHGSSQGINEQNKQKPFKTKGKFDYEEGKVFLYCVCGEVFNWISVREAPIYIPLLYCVS